MANITKRGNSYRIRVFAGTDKNGKKITRQLTAVIAHNIRSERKRFEFPIFLIQSILNSISRNFRFGQITSNPDVIYCTTHRSYWQERKKPSKIMSSSVNRCGSF